MKTLSERFDAERMAYLLPAMGGAFIALIAVVILRYPYVWAGLITIGIAVFVFSLAAKDFRNYWLGVFALVLPLDIRKALFGSDQIRALEVIYGFPLGELPSPILYLSDLPFLVLMVQWFFQVIFRKQKIFFPKSNWIALAFIIWSGISLTNATAFSYGFFDLMRLVKFYLQYLYVANNIRSKATVKILIRFLLIGMIFQGLICLDNYKAQRIGHIFGNLFGQQAFSEEDVKKYEQFFSVGQEGGGRLRASGTAGPINAQAQYFELLIPIAFSLWLTMIPFGRSSFDFACLIFGLTGLILTFSRGGFIGLAGGLIAVLILSRWVQLISNKKFLTFFLIGIGLCITVTPLVYTYIMVRPEATLARIDLNKVGLEMIKAHPIIGVGLNNHMVEKPKYDPKDYIIPMPTHNRYLLIASEVGIPGLLFFLGFLWLTLKTTLRAARTEDRYLASVALGILGAFVATLLHYLIDHLTFHTPLTMVWLYAGLVAALVELRANPSEKVS